MVSLFPTPAITSDHLLGTAGPAKHPNSAKRSKGVYSPLAAVQMAKKILSLTEEMKWPNLPAQKGKRPVAKRTATASRASKVKKNKKPRKVVVKRKAVAGAKKKKKAARAGPKVHRRPKTIKLRGKPPVLAKAVKKPRASNPTLKRASKMAQKEKR